MEIEDPPGAQVSAWLKATQQHVRDYLINREEPSLPELSDAIVRCLRGLCPQLPLSYSFTPVSQLVSLQHSPCVSLLGWGTERFQAWSAEGQKHARDPPSATDKVLPRARLLLLGYVTDEPPGDGSQHDGSLYFQDGSGSIPCEMSHLDLSLIGALVLLPCWSYIPSCPPVSSGGYIEVLEPPLRIFPPPPSEDKSDPASLPALTPTSALLHLHDRSRSRKERVSVSGKLASVTSFLNVRQKVFFFFLEDSETSVPVIVQTPSKLSWYHALCVGKTYKVTSLTVFTLRGSQQRVFAVGGSSCLLCLPPPLLPLPVAYAKEEAEDRAPLSDVKNDHRPQQRPKGDKEKVSKILSYKGVLTRVLDARAGLYELDRKVTLCTAYLQLLSRGRGLREGATVEVSDAHFQQSPSPLFPTIVLSCCLRSRLRVVEFSRLCSPCLPASVAGYLHVHLLLQYRLALPEYLWVSDIMEKLRQKLCPRYVTQRCLSGSVSSGTPGIAENLLSQTLSSFSNPKQRSERHLHEEVFGDPHNCPLQTYSPMTPPWCIIPFAKLPSLVSNSRPSQTDDPIQDLHWSSSSLCSQDLLDRPVLVGVFHVSSSGSLKLKDQTDSLTCMVLPRAPIAWIGCVLEVRRYRVVSERIQNKGKSEGQRKKTYVLFLACDVRILHPYHSCPFCPQSTSSLSPSSKKSRVDGPRPCRLFLVEALEGQLPDHDGRLRFQARAVWLGAPRLLDDAEGEKREQDQHTKIALIFSRSSVRWHHFLLPNRAYRLIANGATDLGIFNGPSKQPPKIQQSLCLSVPGEWTLQDVETSKPLLTPEEPLSVEEALKLNSTGSLLSVNGVMTQRSMCDMQNTRLISSRTRVPETFLPPGVSLKVTLGDCVSQACVSVYMDLSWVPYPLGLLPGATLSLQGMERKVSRTGNVYLRSTPVTCVRVLSLPAEHSLQALPPPLVLFAQLPGLPAPRRTVCSVSHVLSMTLYWECSLCRDIFTKGACSRSPTCSSQSGAFRARASVKAEDGSGEALLHLQDEAVLVMLGVSDRLWEALKTRVLSTGKVIAKNRGRNCDLTSEEKSEDVLQCYLTSVMSRPAVSRPLIATFTQRGCVSGSLRTEMMRFTRGERDYITQVPAARNLHCLHLQEADPRSLCHVIRERSQSDAT
ncbi:CST complex subunit CTC1 [Spea bombifrons]|uniref:CST complex subunit CTC1 n=1 Tax=Spea bombifrons TaxID=233779 RepID=UPI00234A12F8|nr:CST complex subunit CTC1 [Spea bombifrons]